MTVCTVICRIAGSTPDGAPILDRRLPLDGEQPQDGEWLAEQDAEAWWDEIVASNRGRQLLGKLAALIGDGRTPSWVVSARQIRLALRRAGLREAIEQAVYAAGGEVADWWEYSVDVDRYSPIVGAMLGAIGAASGRPITDAEVDAIWQLAETL